MRSIHPIKTFKLVLLYVLVLGLLSCNFEQQDTTSTEEDKQLIKQALKDMWYAIETEDMEAYASYVHPEFTQFGETDPVLRVGKEAELKGIADWVAESDDIHTEMIEPRVTVRGDMAFISYYWKDQGTSNGVPFRSSGKSTRIFVKEDNKWLCIHGHYTLLTQE